MEQSQNMAEHVRILAWLNIILGGIGVFTALMIFAGASVIGMIIQAVLQGSPFPFGLIQLVATVITTIVLVTSLPCLILGFGLYNLRPWARILGIVLAALNLINVPLGTIASLYAFWVLLKPETEMLFAAPSAYRPTV